MADENMSLFAVSKRLLTALELPSEAALAEMLGFKQPTWAMRKRRNSIPKKEIDALCEQYDLNPEYVYQGSGNVYVNAEGESWESLYMQRAVGLGRQASYLKPMGHAPEFIAKLAKPRAGSEIYKTLAALRDYQFISHIDLNWLICARPAEAVDALANDERMLLDLYRSASASDKQFIVRSAMMAGRTEPAPRIRQRAGRGAQQIAGDVSAPVVFAPTAKSNKSKSRSKK